MRQLKSRWPYLVLALLLSYTVLSLVPPTVWTDNIAAVALLLGITAVAIFVYFRWLRSRLGFLRSWPTPVANARIRRILSLGDFSPRTARTPRQIALSMLILSFMIVLPFSLWLTLFGTDFDGFGETASRLSVLILLGTLLLGPVFHGLAFRLRVKYDLKSGLLAILMYLPIFILLLAVLMHSFLFLVDDDLEFLTISWSDMFIPTYMGTMLCVLMVLLFRVGISPLPAPTLTTHRLYRMSEMATFLVSLAGLAIILILAS